MRKSLLHKFDVFKGFDQVLTHGVSTREGGVSEGPFASLNLGLQVDDKEENVRENYERFCGALGVDIDKVCIAYQEHTDKVLVVRKEDVESGRLQIGLDNVFEGIDGFMTDVKGVPLMVRFADCQGVLMFDPLKKVIAAVHSGWKGNVQNIIGKTVLKMVAEFGCEPSSLLVGISPSLGPCCAEFSDPYNELPKFMHQYVKDGRVDLWQCSLDQLYEAGVSAEKIELSGRCTVCENDKFFSYRGGKKITGHMGGLVMLNNDV
ncbi:MAG: peptidoglycan editing factor PgeF [Candidatus Curtissbacteria bacterium]|nr:peptidoglycan editing factor PgeF [Candidatus Curtissbacteria bacterium]